jgi:hypothetical protein
MVCLLLLYQRGAFPVEIVCVGQAAAAWVGVPEGEQLVRALAAACVQLLVSEGKIRYVGLSEVGPKQIR